MKIISCNVNGIRSAAAKGFFSWLAEQKPDFVCLQEIKALHHQFPAEASLPDMHRYILPAVRPGYAGVALYANRQPLRVITRLGELDAGINWRDFDDEGRFLLADFGELAIASVYFPSGSSSAERQAAKMRFLERFLPLARRLARHFEHLAICGDFNIAHQHLDIRNWRSNQKHSGFLPEERAWFGCLLREGFTDTFRRLHPTLERYSWWSNRGRARENDVGWRIDYIVANHGLASTLSSAWIAERTPRFSDHAPVIAEFAG